MDDTLSKTIRDRLRADDPATLGLAQAPLDPFTGKGLPYRRTEAGGAVVYSVGPNGVDDGGKVGPKQGTPLDTLWELKP